jgi:hypothetical protein
MGAAPQIPGSGTTLKDDPWFTILGDEYKILQDKIDKIGGFRFTIKGWSVTVTTGVLAGATATGASGWIALLALVVAVAFFLLEWQLQNLRFVYMGRALEIETVMVRLRSGSIKDLSSVRFIPGIAVSIMRAAERRRKPITLRKLCTDPELVIYPIQAIVILVVAAGLYFSRTPAPAQATTSTIIMGTVPGDAGAAVPNPAQKKGPEMR